MKVLVDGAAGLLGQEIVSVFKDKHEVIGIDIADLDITDYKKAKEKLAEIRPDVLIHSAGFRFVEESEKNPKMCYSINALGTKNMALAAERVGAKMVHISSGAVFDGKLQRTYTEFEEPRPVNVYGHSKLMSERMVQTYSSKHFILRISLLFGAMGNPETNMVGKLMRKLKEGQTSIPYPTDLCFTPTYTKDLATAIFAMIETDAYGTYHITNRGTVSRFDMSGYIAKKLGYSSDCLKPIQVKSSDEPNHVILCGLALEKTFGIVLRDWHEAMDECIEELKNIE